MSTQVFVDPVCLMETTESDPFYDYHHKTYYFCCEQCRQKFMERPQLYVSDDGHRPAKKSTGQLIRQRKFRLSKELDNSEAENLIRALKELMGILHVEISGRCISISYDLLQTSAEQIEQQIEAAGDVLNNGFGESLKRGFIHYLEDTELENLLEQKDTHCH